MEKIYYCIIYLCIYGSNKFKDYNNIILQKNNFNNITKTIMYNKGVSLIDKNVKL